MAIKKNVPAADAGINFGDLGMYSAGGGIPEGDYIWSDLTTMMHQAETKTGEKRGQPRLGVMITMLPLDDPKDENAKTKFYSMGTNADKVFAPNPQTGKGLVVIPGASGSTLNETSNWALLLKSLYDSGLPQGIFSNDLSVLEGMWVHVANVPEPEERKQFRATAATGEAGAEPQRAGTIPIVTEIKDDGKPWENTGGMPTAKAATKPNGKAVVKPAAKPAAPAEPAEETNDDLATAATNAVADVMTRNMNGILKLKLRTETFAVAKKASGEGTANDIINSYFGSDDALNAILGPLGFSVKGSQVAPA